MFQMRIYHYGSAGNNFHKRHKVMAILKRLCADSSCKSVSPADVVNVEKAALYVHWPYCKRRCTYCNFNKYISNNVDHRRMRRCLQQETAHLIRTSCAREITSVFFGGGTPSLAEPKTLEAVLAAASRETTLAAGAEISMEINPTNLEINKMRDFHAVGINRASIGVQTLNDAALKILGRDHNSSDSLRCLERASEIFQKQTSVDLMFGYPGQTLDMWRTELTEMLSLCDDHISLYQLTLERGTRLFKDVAAGSLALPSADEMADMYLAAQEILDSHGFEQYEVSNFAKGGKYSRHNIGYWTGQQYIGVGPGSHGRVWKTADGGTPHRLACVQTLEPDNWMWEVERFGHATRKSVPQTSKDILEELVSVSLRTKWGLQEKNWAALLPTVSLEELSNLRRTADWIRKGFLETTACWRYVDSYIPSSDDWVVVFSPSDSGLRATPSGTLILDSILPDILLDIDTLMTPCHHSRKGG